MEHLKGLLGSAAWAMVVVVLGVLGGCGMTITPEANLIDPVEVFVVDHGIHTSLVLPRDDGTLRQFAYSRFDWAALDQDQWYRSLPAIMVPGDGTIGMRDFPGPPTRENVLHQFEVHNTHPPLRELYVVPVSDARRRAVLSALEARWAANEETVVLNKKRGLRFVRDGRKYSLGHNCNHEVAQWMRELGCGVEGMGMTAEVRVR